MAGIGLFGLLDNTLFFLTLIVLIFSIGGIMSGGLEMGLFSGFLVFVTLAFKADYTMYNNLLYVVIAVMTIITSFQIYNLTQNGDEI